MYRREAARGNPPSVLRESEEGRERGRQGEVWQQGDGRHRENIELRARKGEDKCTERDTTKGSVCRKGDHKGREGSDTEKRLLSKVMLLKPRQRGLIRQRTEAIQERNRRREGKEGK